MKRYNALIVALALAASASAASAQMAEPTTRPPTATIYTARVRISWGQAGVSFGQESITKLLESPSRLCQRLPGEISKHVKNLEHVSFAPLLSSGIFPPQRGYLLGEYYLRFGSPVKEATARKVMEALVGQLRLLLLAEHKMCRSRIERKLGHARQASNAARAKVSKLRNELAERAKTCAGAGVTWKLESNRASISKLAGQLRQTDVERAAKTERLKAVREQIAKLVRDAHAHATAKDEPVVAKLRALTETQARELKALRAKLGPEHRSVKALESKFANLEAQLAKAFVDQEARRDAALKGAGTPELIAKLKAEGIALMIDLREMEARTVALKRELAAAQAKSGKLVAQLRDWQTARMLMEGMRVDLSLAVNRYETASTRADELTQQLSVLEEPTATILKPPSGATARAKGGK